MSRAPVPPAPVTRLMVKLMGGMLLRPQVSDIRMKYHEDV